MAALAVMVTVFWKNSVEDARQTKCLTQLRMIGTAAMTFAAENDMRLPGTVHDRRSGVASWTKSLPGYSDDTLEFRCPCDPDPQRPVSYVINDFLTRNPSGATDLNYSHLTRLATPASTLFFAEAADGFIGDHFHFAGYRGRRIPPSAVETQIAVRRHDGSANYLFADGHAENLSWEAVQATLAVVPSSFIDPTQAQPTPTPTPK